MTSVVYMTERLLPTASCSTNLHSNFYRIYMCRPFWYSRLLIDSNDLPLVHYYNYYLKHRSHLQKWVFIAIRSPVFKIFLSSGTLLCLLDSRTLHHRETEEVIRTNIQRLQTSSLIHIPCLSPSYPSKKKHYSPNYFHSLLPTHLMRINENNVRISTEVFPTTQFMLFDKILKVTFVDGSHEIDHFSLTSYYSVLVLSLIS